MPSSVTDKLSIGQAATLLRGLDNKADAAERLTRIAALASFEPDQPFVDLLRFAVDNTFEFLTRLPPRSYSSDKSFAKVSAVFGAVASRVLCSRRCSSTGEDGDEEDDEMQSLRRLHRSWKANYKQALPRVLAARNKGQQQPSSSSSSPDGPAATTEQSEPDRGADDEGRDPPLPASSSAEQEQEEEKDALRAEVVELRADVVALRADVARLRRALADAQGRATSTARAWELFALHASAPAAPPSHTINWIRYLVRLIERQQDPPAAAACAQEGS